MRIDFVKLSGSGNDFICVDGRDGWLNGLLADGGASGLARTLCRRGMGIGADGLIFAVEPEVEGFADIGARFFEPDGSEAELCGNGTACFIDWVIANGWANRASDVKIFTPAGVVTGKHAKDGYVRVCIPDPEQMQSDVKVTVGGMEWTCDFAVTGVPHVIIFVDCVEGVDISHLGPAFRFHERFAPRGVNANFVQVLSPGKLAIRTYEFGVEAETLACGTGSAAAAIMAALRFGWDDRIASGNDPVEVTARSGDVLKIWFHANGPTHVVDVCLETTVRQVCRGAVAEPLVARALGNGGR